MVIAKPWVVPARATVTYLKIKKRGLETSVFRP